MPELPEVETVRRDLQKLLKGSKILEVEVRKDKMVQGETRRFKKAVQGQIIRGIQRRGKLLIIVLGQKFKDGKKPNQWMLIHLKMTGQLIYRSKSVLVGGGHGLPRVQGEELPNKYSHVIFTLSDGAQLFFNDMRQFGYIKLVNEAGLKEALSRYGIEPLSRKFASKELAKILSSKKSTIKQVLLNQQVIAGLGNIYVDEVCYSAGIRPTRRANQLTVREVNKLRMVIIRVLKKSIQARGTTFSNYRDGLGGEGRFVKMLKVYGRAGKPCYRCRALLKKMKTGGRGTVYCATCQK